MTQIVVPPLGESVSEATVSRWLKKVGEEVRADEMVVELETDKVTLEVNAPASGVITRIAVKAGKKVKVGDVLGTMEERAVSANGNGKNGKAASKSKENKIAEVKVTPLARRLMEENNLSASQVPASGKNGRVTKEDVENYLASAASAVVGNSQSTVFNEVDMKPVMDLQDEYKDAFEKKHGVKLGLMSFFIKAVVQVLKEFPSLNARIDGEEKYNIGIELSAPQGLVVTVLRDADKLSMAEIEAKIYDFEQRAREEKLETDELMGGTYTVTDGGEFGSLMSTPVLNSPQSGVLGMHVIQNRPVVMKDGSIEARPMMHLAQSYDHRIVDGREAVSSLARIKQLLEDPKRLVLDV